MIRSLLIATKVSPSITGTKSRCAGFSPKELYERDFSYPLIAKIATPATAATASVEPITITAVVDVLNGVSLGSPGGGSPAGMPLLVVLIDGDSVGTRVGV
eukprot:CAMPEP_0204849820 /NCGR_PEP_ID=MMETSP1347-20130617/6910_1 /ASSEMBLY_ACC=CAM_ASM_000690 /TAXON_ID=215587 /ORGANISM="Aplanochytrium stocchinoi, Strain GSBS06" /LENGTH=100 /DNA_ID=CAMNT_0051992349 /DNA_START=147 /DNA_END=449 /DNA_ORIENTATION=+